MSESSPRAFEHLYRRHAPRVRRALAELGVQDAALDDATQEVFLVLARRLPEFDRERSLVNWLWGIARGVASTQRRSARRFDRLRATLPTADAPIDPEDLAMQRDRLRVLTEFLDELDESSCAIFLLSDVYAWSGPEIATRLGLNVNTVYARLRALRRRWNERLSRRRRTGAVWSAIFGVPFGPIAVGVATVLAVALAPSVEAPPVDSKLAAGLTEARAGGQGPIERADRARVEESDMHTIIAMAVVLAAAAPTEPPTRAPTRVATEPEDADEAAFRGSAGGVSVYEGFDDELVQGEHLTPEGGLILHRRPPKHPSLIRVRTHFVPELIRLARSI